MLGAPVDSRVLDMAGVERPDMKVKLEELDALATEAVNDPTKFGRLLNTAMMAGAAAGAAGQCASGLSDTFVQDVACGRQHACCFPGPAQPAQLSGHPGHFGHGCWHR